LPYSTLGKGLKPAIKKALNEAKPFNNNLQSITWK